MEPALPNLLTKLESENVTLDREKIEMEVNSDAALYSNLAVKILSILGGILGSIFLILFLLVLGLWDSPTGQIGLGILFFVSALLVSKINTSIFLATVNISMWIIGIGMIGTGLFSNNLEINVFAIGMLLLGFLTFIISQRFLLQFLSVLLVTASMAGLILENNWYDLIHVIIIGCVLKMTYLHLYEAAFISKHKFFNERYESLRLGLIFSLIGCLFLLGKGGRISGYDFNYLWISAIIIIGASLFSIYKITADLEINQSDKTIVMVLATVIFLPTIFSPLISGAILILILNYHLGYRTGIAIGVITLIYSVSQYYYDLNLTLLQKSTVLMLSGVLFLIAYFILNRKVPKIASHEEL